jgi:hypothetical protein
MGRHRGAQRRRSRSTEQESTDLTNGEAPAAPDAPSLGAVTPSQIRLPAPFVADLIRAVQVAAARTPDSCGRSHRFSRQSRPPSSCADAGALPLGAVSQPRSALLYPSSTRRPSPDPRGERRSVGRAQPTRRPWLPSLLRRDGDGRDDLGDGCRPTPTNSKMGHCTAYTRVAA